MNRGSTLFLKLSIYGIGLAVLAIAVLLLPQVLFTAIDEALKGGQLGLIVLALLTLIYISAIPFYIALYQALKLLNYIDNNNAFSELSVIALMKIKNCAKVISGLYFVSLPFVYVVAQWDDAPGLILIALIVAGSSLIIAVFAAVLQRLLQQAINIKSENDLTI